MYAVVPMHIASMTLFTYLHSAFVRINMMHRSCSFNHLSTHDVLTRHDHCHCDTRDVLERHESVRSYIDSAFLPWRRAVTLHRGLLGCTSTVKKCESLRKFELELHARAYISKYQFRVKLPF